MGRGKKNNMGVTGIPLSESPKKNEKWSTVLNNTDVLRGWRPCDTEKPDILVDVDKASSPIFELRKKGTLDHKNPHHFQEESRTYSTRIEQILLEAAFTDKAIRTAMMGAIPNLSLGLESQIEWQKKLKAELASIDKHNSVYVYYSHLFPCSILSFSAESLKPSGDVKKWMKERDSANLENIEKHLKDFQDSFGNCPTLSRCSWMRLIQILSGTVFAKRVWLGGRAYRTKLAHTSSGSQNQVFERERTIKTHAKAIVPFSSLKIGSDTTTAEASQQEEASQSSETWLKSQILGGNRNLVPIKQDPSPKQWSAWHKSVADYHSWEAIQFEEVDIALPFLVDIINARPEPPPGTWLIQAMAKTLKERQDIVKVMETLTLSLKFTHEKSWKAKVWPDKEDMVKTIELYLNGIQPRPFPYIYHDWPIRCDFKGTKRLNSSNARIRIHLQTKYKFGTQIPPRLPKGFSCYIFPSKNECLVSLDRKLEDFEDEISFYIRPTH